MCILKVWSLVFVLGWMYHLNEGETSEIVQLLKNNEEVINQELVTSLELQYDELNHFNQFLTLPHHAFVSNIFKRSKRAFLHFATFNQLQSCSSSDCQDAFTGATCLTNNTTRNDSEYYLCNGEKIWKILVLESGCLCTNIYEHSQPVLALAAQSMGLFWLNSNKTSLFILNTTNHNETSIIPSVAAVGYGVLDVLCNTFFTMQENPTIYSVNGSYVKLHISAMLKNQTAVSPLCKNFTQSYTFNISVLYADNAVKSCIGNQACLKQSFLNVSDEISINNLIPETKYFMQFYFSKSYYNHSLVTFSPFFNVTTVCGVSTVVSNLTCQPQSYDIVKIMWNEPLFKNSHKLLYRVIVGSFVKNITSSNRTLQFQHKTTEPKTYYVRAYALDCLAADGLFSSVNILCSPFSSPPKLNVKQATSTTITLQWEFSQSDEIRNVTLLWSEVLSEAQTWKRSSTLPGSADEDTITDLKPYTNYQFRIEVVYISGKAATTSQDFFKARTAMGVPLSPTDVKVVNTNLLTWQAPSSIRSSEIISYSVESRNRSAPGSSHILFGNWSVVEVKSVRTGRSWEISNLTDKEWYEFRVYATNNVGRGDTSLTTAPHYYLIPVEDNWEWLMNIIICSVVGAIVLLVVIIGCWKYRAIKKRKKALPSHITMVHTNYDIELAQLRHMNSLAKAAANQGGRANLPADFRERLPVFPREKLTLGSQLGRGNFGEVYKGIAIDIKESDCGDETAVAVKTLRETASEHEQREFLMEAYFMNLFDHPNILSLLGVCLDNEPQFIILELMEGGDLLKYLREARPSLKERSGKLTISDLLDISVDLAAGCLYLETRHFIHRDLAARNCLVSTKSYDSNQRVVKIGDFGLARDIYKNDYYHMEGEGQLPVRWMAPEAIALQRYTVQSDVWSFGVVLWEVMTLGQQPYSVYNNSEAFELVKGGTKLDRPEGCPMILYTLMLRCWDLQPSNRPTFQEIFRILQNFKEQHMLSNLKRSIVRLHSGPINYDPVHAQDDADAVFIRNSAQFFDNPAFTFEEVSRESIHSTELSLDGHRLPPTGVISPDDVMMTSSDNLKEAAPVPTPAAPDNIDNYARLQFAPSRETSVKSVLPNRNSDPVQMIPATSDIDETKPMKTFGASSDATSMRNHYVTSPVPADSRPKNNPDSINRSKEEDHDLAMGRRMRNEKLSKGISEEQIQV